MQNKKLINKCLSKEEIRVLTNFSENSRLSYKVKKELDKQVKLKKKYRVLESIDIK